MEGEEADRDRGGGREGPLEEWGRGFGCGDEVRVSIFRNDISKTNKRNNNERIKKIKQDVKKIKRRREGGSRSVRTFGLR